MKSARTAASTVALALALTACGGSAGSGGANGSGGRPVDGKTFTMAIPSDPGALDPHFTSLSVAYQVDLFLYDSLVAVDASGKEVAGLASSWKGDSTSATYTLRKGVTCSDGTPLTAQNIADNINFVGNTKNGSSRVGVMVPAGAKATADKAAGTVHVTSKTPDAFLTRNVGSLPIVCGKGMKNRSALKHGASGTGMFTLTEAVADDHYTLTRRKDYAWGPGKWKPRQQGLPDKVVLKVLQNQSTAANLLLSGQLNAARITGPDGARLTAKNLLTRQVGAPLGELWFNQKPGEPGADPAVRRALTQALDLGKLGKVMGSGEGKKSRSMVAGGMGPCRQDTVSGSLPAYDRAAAGATLDAAGWKKGAGGIREKDGKKLTMEFVYPTSYGAGTQTGAELLRDSWKSVGAQVTLKAVTDAQAGEVVVSGQGSWSAAFLPLNVSLPTQIVPFVSGGTPPKGTNFAFIDNASYEAHVKKAMSRPGAKGCTEWAAAEKALFRQADIVLFVDQTTRVYASGATLELTEGSVLPSSVRMVA